MNKCEIVGVVKRELSRGALLTGSAGGIIGAVAGGIGIMWSILDMIYVMEIGRAMNDPLLLILWFSVSPLSMLVYGSTLTPISGLYFAFSMILAILLLVGGILTGAGFYGVYQAGGGAMGVLGLAFGIIGGAAGSIFLILGNVLTASVPIFIFVTIPIPAYLLIFVGFAILGVSLILMGSASLAVRDATAHSSAATAAGVLSIVGGCFLFPYVLVWIFLTILGGIFALIGFALILSAFAIWAAVFYGSREI